MSAVPLAPPNSRGRTRPLAKAAANAAAANASAGDSAGGSLAQTEALPPGVHAVESHVSGSVWKVLTPSGSQVKAGDPLLIVESMKMEVVIEAPNDGTVVETLATEGMAVSPGQWLLKLRAGG